MSKNRILFFDPQRKNRRDAVRILSAAGCEVIVPESFKKLEEAILEQQFQAYALDIEGHQHINAKGVHLASIPTIVLSDSPLSDIHPYLAELQTFTNFIAKRSNNALHNSDLLGTIAKIMHNDIFGLKKYLAWGAHTWTFHIRDAATRREYIEFVKAYGKNLGLRTAILKKMEVVVEELLMNAIYDAPVDSRGNRLYNHMPRSQNVTLDVMHAARLEFGSDGRRLAISVTDPFGSITRDLVLRCLSRCFTIKDGPSFSEESGGAGLGLFFCYKHVDSLIINVDPERKTEFIGIIDIEQSLKDSKKEAAHTALHFFNLDNHSPLFLQNGTFTSRRSA